ncbi:KAP family P-loop NTPase fold protein [Bacillus sp. JJ722]|uniref:KAP family P-loop NTPase fold protein n=1 Tax=Bacillus sp. JJ722 TaxID=3122973 RepID=UPI002FFE3820
MLEEINYLPVDDTSYDKLDFKSKAIEIASVINNFPTYSPFSISINGPWGSGKSTMLNFIEQSLDKKKCNIIRFNPWTVSDEDSLITNLFEEIYYEIDGGVTNAKQKFAEYAQKIISPATKLSSYVGALSNGIDPRMAGVISNSAGESAKGIGEILFTKPLSKRKKELHKEMKLRYSDTEQKIVVLIDELDRLFPDEIITVFQMIKSALDFPGLVFVVAMDEIIINEALIKIGINNPTYYLEKISREVTMYGLHIKLEHCVITCYYRI